MLLRRLELVAVIIQTLISNQSLRLNPLVVRLIGLILLDLGLFLQLGVAHLLRRL